VFSLGLFPARTAAQSATAGAIVGTVMDPQQAAVIGAKVTIQNRGVDQTSETLTGGNGQYSFPSVVPGVYKVTVTMKGFRTATVPDFTIEVAKSYTLDIKMELGEVSETVEVAAGAQVELQTTDATVGIVLPASEIERFPALTRQVNELLTLHPVPRRPAKSPALATTRAASRSTGSMSPTTPSVASALMLFCLSTASRSFASASPTPTPNSVAALVAKSP